MRVCIVGDAADGASGDGDVVRWNDADGVDLIDDADADGDEIECPRRCCCGCCCGCVIETVDKGADDLGATAEGELLGELVGGDEAETTKKGFFERV